MTHAARLTQKRLEGEIEKLLEGQSADLYVGPKDCAFCKKYKHSCPSCSFDEVYPGDGCLHGDFFKINEDMYFRRPSAIPGALAIHLWLYEL